jgi:hypothetical protein
MQDNCFYRGFVKGITGSQVAMDICDGAIHGSIHLPGSDIIAIMPLHLKEQRKHVHFLSTEEEPGNEIATRCARGNLCVARIELFDSPRALRALKSEHIAYRLGVDDADDEGSELICSQWDDSPVDTANGSKVVVFPTR